MSGPILLYRLLTSCLGKQNIIGIKVLGDYVDRKKFYLKDHIKRKWIKKEILKYKNFYPFASFKENNVIRRFEP